MYHVTLFFLWLFLQTTSMLYCLTPSNPYLAADPKARAVLWIITKDELMTSTPLQPGDQIVGIGFTVEMQELGATSPLLTMHILESEDDYPTQTMLQTLLEDQTDFRRVFKKMIPIDRTALTQKHFYAFEPDAFFTWKGTGALCIKTTTDNAFPIEARAPSFKTPYVSTLGMQQHFCTGFYERPSIELIVKHCSTQFHPNAAMTDTAPQRYNRQKDLH